MQRVARTDRGVLKLSGSDMVTFLQGLVSNDVTKVDGTAAVFSALLTPQGKFLYDFFMVADGDAILFDCRAEDTQTFAKKLKMFKLRSDVTVEDISADYTIHCLYGADTMDTLRMTTEQQKRDNGSILFRDPRLPEAGVRALVPADVEPDTLGGDNAPLDDYHAFRIPLGLPEAPIDLQPDKSILLESGFDELHGVDWDKGCYMGQELTARTKYRGLIKKRLVPVEISGDAETGMDLMAAGKTVGDLRSVQGSFGLALIKLDALSADTPITAGHATLNPIIPSWMVLPDKADA